MKVSVITPTIGNTFLSEAIESVRFQNYKNIEHVVVVDGKTRWKTVKNILKKNNFPNGEKEHICVLPYPTGVNRYNGHRVYGSATFFVDGDYHVWLDEDNIFEINHIQNFVDLVESKNLDWAYSFRKIIDKDSKIVCLDDCESLGIWPSVLNSKDFFIDVNCYFVKKQLAVQISHLWYRKFREQGQLEVDRAIASVLMNPRNNLKFDCTKKYTTKYRVGNTNLSVTADFFIKGNDIMLKKYNGILPWK